MAMSWAQFTAQPNGTRVYNHGWDQCVALANQFQEEVLGGAFVPVDSAYQWWTNYSSLPQLTSKYVPSTTPVAGAVFIGRYGIYQAANGHIGVVTSVNGNGTFNTMEQNAGTWRYLGRYTRGMANILGFLIPRNNPATPVIEPTQRQVGANPVKRRQGPSTSSAELPDPLQPGTIGNFNGWIYGEQVNDGVANTNVWYRGTSGNFFWAGGFTKISGDGLTNLNPVTPPPTPVPPTPVPPTPTPTRKPVSETTPNWDMTAPEANPVYPVPTPKASGVEFPAEITQRVEAVSLNGYTVGRVDPKGPNHIVLHHAATDSLSGAVNTLRGTNGAPTASYVVKDRELVEMVPEGSSPWTNGRWTSNMYSVTFEMCNASGSSATGWFPPSAATCETTAWAMARAAQRWNIELPLEHGVNVFGHKEVSKTSTACPGSLDIDAVVKRANEIIESHPVPAPGPDVDVAKIAVLTEDIAGKFVEISNILKGN